MQQSGDETGAVADLWAGRSFTSCDCRSCKTKGAKKTQEKTTVSQTQEQTDDQIRQSYEKQLESVLSQVEGVGAVQVAVAMESTGKKQVEKDSPEDTSTSSEKGDSGTQRSSQTVTTGKLQYTRIPETGDRHPIYPQVPIRRSAA